MPSPVGESTMIVNQAQIRSVRSKGPWPFEKTNKEKSTSRQQSETNRLMEREERRVVSRTLRFRLSAWLNRKTSFGFQPPETGALRSFYPRQHPSTIFLHNSRFRVISDFYNIHYTIFCSLFLLFWFLCEEIDFELDFQVAFTSCKNRTAIISRAGLWAAFTPVLRAFFLVVALFSLSGKAKHDHTFF